MTNATTTLALNVIAKDEASKVLKDVERNATGLGKTLQDVGKIAGGFLAANVVAGAGDKILGFFSDSIKQASDLQQAVGGVQSIFKDSAAEILDWGNKNASSFGLSKRAFAEAIGPLGAMLKNAGFDMETVSQQSLKLTERAADMAATFGGSVDDALTAVSAALRGETDPIERYGVSVSAAKVELRALADTGKTAASQLTDQEKAAARLAIIFDQTADSAGQFARESGTAAGKAEIATAKYENLQATLGEKLLPIQIAVTEAKIKLVDVLATKVIPYLEELYAKHWPAVQKAIEDLTPVIQFFADYLMTRVEGVIQAIQGMYDFWSGIVALVDDVIHGRWAAAWDDLQQIASGAVQTVIGIITSTFGNLPEKLYNVGRDSGKALLDGIKDAAGAVGSSILDQAARTLDSANPFRAAGGPVSAGNPYIVGERGAELFVPGRSGTIVPNHALSGGGGPVVNVHVYGSIRSDQDIAQIIRDAITRGGFRGVAA